MERQNKPKEMNLVISELIHLKKAVCGGLWSLNKNLLNKERTIHVKVMGSTFKRKKLSAGSILEDVT